MLEAAELPELVERYEVWLERQPLSERTRREYARQVAGFAEWLGADPALDGDALADSFARDYAARDFKRHLKLERRWSPASVNLALAAVDHFFRFVGLGAADVTRERLPQAAPRALDSEEVLAFVRAAGRATVAIGMLLVYAGLRLSELVALDLDDARVSGRKAVVVIRSGKGDMYREVPLGDRSDAGLVLLAACDRHAAVRRARVPSGAVPRAHRRRRGPQDVDLGRQRPRPVQPDRRPRRGHAALAAARRRQPVAVAARQRRAPRRGAARVPATLWNTYYFFVTYANLAGWSPAGGAPGVSERPVMDRYILAELTDATAEVDAAMADFDATRAGRRIAEFIDLLSNWYVRLSRPRFSGRDPGTRADSAPAAFATLHRCLSTLAGLLAPFTPFLADELYENLVGSVEPDAPDSVHLTAYPVADEALRDDALRDAIGVARQLVTLGRDARSAGRVALRQPLRRAVVTGAGDMPDELRELIASEINVKQLTFAGGEDAGLITLSVRPNYRALGPEFGKRTPAVAAAIASTDARAVVAQLRAAGECTVQVDGEPVRIRHEQVKIVEQPVTGWQISTAGANSVALDLNLDDDLQLEGLAREFVRMANDLRRRRRLRLDDRVNVDVLIADDPGRRLETMLDRHGSTVAAEILAESLCVAPATDGADAHERLPIGDGALLVDVRVAAARSV